MYQPGPAPAESQPHSDSMVPKSSNPASQKRIPCCLRQQLEAASQPALTPSAQGGGRSFKQLADAPGGAETLLAHSEDKSADRGPLRSANVPALQSQSPLSRTSHVKHQNSQPASAANCSSNSATSSVKFTSHHERPDPKELGSVQPASQHRKAACEKTQALEIQETPVRDEGSSSDWSLVSDLESNDGFLYPVRKASSSAQAGSCQQLPMTDLCSYPKEDASILGQHASSYKDKALLKNQVTNYSKGPPTVNPSADQLSPARVQQSAAGLCPALGKSYSLLHSRKRIQDPKAFQQDSGFDSPQINFD